MPPCISKGAFFYPKFEKVAGLCRHRPLLTNPSTAYSGPPPFTREAKW